MLRINVWQRPGDPETRQWSLEGKEDQVRASRVTEVGTSFRSEHTHFLCISCTQTPGAKSAYTARPSISNRKHGRMISRTQTILDTHHTFTHSNTAPNKPRAIIDDCILRSKLYAVRIPYPPENKPPPFFSSRHDLDWGGAYFRICTFPRI